MKTLLVTGMEESTGKTAVALALALAAKERGIDVGYMKPLGTRLRSAVGKTRDEDPLLARELLDGDDSLQEMEPVVYSPTFVEEAIRGREDPEAIRDRISEAFDDVSENRDLMIVEGGGTLATGGAIDLTDADVAELLDADVVLLSSYDEPGDVDEVLLAKDLFGDRLAGTLFNTVPDGLQDKLEGEVAGYLEGQGVPVLGIVGRDPELAGISVEELSTELGAEVLTSEAPTDALVERFQVGAMSAEAALQYFRRTTDAAVITGGDRADVQTAALQAPGVKCLVLTGGHRPSSSVLGRAEEEGVPVMLVSADTLTTVDRAEDVIQAGRTRDEATVRRMKTLLSDHADLDALLGE
ncbi:MAG: phosphotransacetylase family protein [Halobacteriales archaeon]